MRRSNKKVIIIIIILLIFIAIGAFCIIKISNTNNKKENSITAEDVNYYLLKDGSKYGVIDKEGNIILKPIYAKIDIPNPEKDFFLCATEIGENENKYIAVNKEKQTLLGEFENIKAISVNELTSYVPYESDTLIYKENNLYGLIDFEGKKITKADYEDITNLDYKNGYLKVKKEGKYGIITTKGKQIVKNEYDNITADGYYNNESQYKQAGFILRIKTDNGYKFGYANEKGNVLLETEYVEITRITEIEDSKDVYLIVSYNGKYGLYKNNKKILSTEYENIQYDKGSNLLIIDKGNAEGVCDLEGKTIIPIDYDIVAIGGDYINTVKDNTNLVFDTQGNRIDTDVTNHTKVSDEYSIIIDKENNYNIVNKDNKKLLKVKYVYLEYFRDNMFIAAQENKTGLIKADGTILIPSIYGTIQKIEGTDLLQATDSETGKIDLINKNGKVKEGFENAYIEKTDNYIKIWNSSELQYFDLNAEPISNRDIFRENQIFASVKNGKWGFIDKSGNDVSEFKYDMVTEENKGVCGFKEGNRWGIINSEGKVILNPTYEINTSIPKFIGTFFEYSSGINVPLYSKDIPNNNE